MSETTAVQVAKLQRMTVIELQTEWERVFGKPTRQRHRAHLIKRLTQRLQDDGPTLTAEEEAQVGRYRAALRQMPPDQWFPGKQRRTRKPTPPPERRALQPGTVITREYMGREIVVTVLEEGFAYEGRVYRSLSAIAKEVTGSHWNGMSFFGLSRRRNEDDRS